MNLKGKRTANTAVMLTPLTSRERLTGEALLSLHTDTQSWFTLYPRLVNRKLLEFSVTSKHFLAEKSLTHTHSLCVCVWCCFVSQLTVLVPIISREANHPHWYNFTHRV